jgi:hypothetical protein
VAVLAVIKRPAVAGEPEEEDFMETHFAVEMAVQEYLMPQYLQERLAVVVAVALTAQDNTAAKDRAVVPREQLAALKVKMRYRTEAVAAVAQVTALILRAVMADQALLSYSRSLTWLAANYKYILGVLIKWHILQKLTATTLYRAYMYLTFLTMKFRWLNYQKVGIG